MIVLLAALAMVAQDVLATILVQAEARNRKVLAGCMDSLQWGFGIATTAISVTALQGHDTGEKVAVVIAVTAANFIGTFVGTAIGERFVKAQAA